MKPQAGDIGFSVIGGGVGAFVALGQMMLADACRYTHVFGVVSGDTVVEAMPRGARVAALDGRDAPGAYRYARLPLLPSQRVEFERALRGYVGRGYGFSTYAYLAAAQWGLPRRLLTRYVSNNERMICSQLVDQALSDAGFHLFSDGRIPQDVTPGDLYYQIQHRGGHFFDWKPGER